jgi:hypothetical protein
MGAMRNMLGLIFLLAVVIILVVIFATHWVDTAFSTYVLHVLHNNGYQWWSGAGSDIGEATVIGAALMLFKRWNCESPWCLRHGKHPTADGLHHLCRKHHPDLGRKLSLAEIHARHFAALGRHGIGSRAAVGSDDPHESPPEPAP